MSDTYCQTKLHRFRILSSLLILSVVFVVYTTISTRKREYALSTDVEPISKDVYLIHDALPPEAFEQLLSMRNMFPYVRKHRPGRSGEAISLKKIRGFPTILDTVRHASLLVRIFEETGMRLTFTPRLDENSISFLRYSQKGDGIDAHYDGNVYIGSRWVGLLILVDDGDASLVVGDKQLPRQMPNTLILFQGDLLKHSVTRRTTDGERTIVNILFCDICAMRTDYFSRIWGTVVSNFGFY